MLSSLKYTIRIFCFSFIFFFFQVNCKRSSESNEERGSTLSIQSNYGTYNADRAVKVTFTNLEQAQYFDWAGIYLDHVTNYSHSSDWIYTCGDQDCYKISKSGSLTFGRPLPVGSYKAVLFCCDEFLELTSSTSFSQISSVYSIESDKDMYEKKENVKVIFNNPEYENEEWSEGVWVDWIGIYKEYETNYTRSLDYMYTCGTKDCTKMTESGKVTFDRPLPVGMYKAVLFCCDGFAEDYSILDTSSIFVQSTSVYSIESDKDSYNEKEYVKISFENPEYQNEYLTEGQWVDWIGIYKHDETNYTRVLDYMYTCGTKDCTRLSKSGEVTFNKILPVGMYKAVLFCCDGLAEDYNILDTSSVFKQTSSVYSIESVKDRYKSNKENIKISFENPFPASGDWIVIQNEDYYSTYEVDWSYTCGSQRCENTVISGVVVFAPFAVGSYKALLYSGNGFEGEYNILAETNFIVV